MRKHHKREARKSRRDKPFEVYFSKPEVRYRHVGSEAKISKNYTSWTETIKETTGWISFQKQFEDQLEFVWRNGGVYLETVNNTERAFKRPPFGQVGPKIEYADYLIAPESLEEIRGIKLGDHSSAVRLLNRYGPIGTPWSDERLLPRAALEYGEVYEEDACVLPAVRFWSEIILLKRALWLERQLRRGYDFIWGFAKETDGAWAIQWPDAMTHPWCNPTSSLEPCTEFDVDSLGLNELGWLVNDGLTRNEMPHRSLQRRNGNWELTAYSAGVGAILWEMIARRVAGELPIECVLCGRVIESAKYSNRMYCDRPQCKTRSRTLQKRRLRARKKAEASIGQES